MLFLGLDSAGKTTLLHVLKHGSVMAHEPTTHAGEEANGVLLSRPN